MKATIYVPDELWERAKQSHAIANTSQLIQQALSVLADSRAKGPDYAAELPENVAETMAAVRDHYSQEARARFGVGYRAGLAYLDEGKAPWHAIQALEEADFDIKRWLAPWVRSFLDDSTNGRRADWPHWLAILGKDEYLGQIGRPIEGDGWYPDRTYLQGFAGALRDVWRAVELGVDPVEEASRAKERRFE